MNISKSSFWVNLLGFSVQRYEQIAYCIFINLKDNLWLWKCSFFAVTVKQPIVFSKQPIVFPLAPLCNAAKFAYGWLNHSSFSNLAFGQIYIECASEFDNKRLYPLVFLKALYHFLFLKCQHCLYCGSTILSFWFLLCTTLLIVYLWEQIGGVVYAWFGCIR